MQTRGRPREFELNDALDRAIEVFWMHGYEGTSLGDLTDAMGINRPSLYAAFGNKESIFKQAITRYALVDMAYVEEALALPTAREVAEHYLRSNVAAITTPGRPPGCLSIQGAMSVAEDHAAVATFVSASRNAAEKRIADRFRRAIAEGDLPADEDAAELALFLTTLTSGLAVRAADGVSRAALTVIAERALRSFPGASATSAA